MQTLWYHCHNQGNRHWYSYLMSHYHLLILQTYFPLVLWSPSLWSSVLIFPSPQKTAFFTLSCLLHIIFCCCCCWKMDILDNILQQLWILIASISLRNGCYLFCDLPILIRRVCVPCSGWQLTSPFVNGTV